MLRFILSALLPLSLSSFAFCQQINATKLGSPVSLYNEGGVSISSQLVECFNVQRNEKMNYKLLTVSNQNGSPVSLKIREDMFYDGQCRTCENEEYTFVFELNANETKAGSCYSDGNPYLAVFESMKDGYIKETLSDFKINVVRLH
ncbi:MAG: hypothetical protein ACK444_09260 [Flavobacteriales bacterium]|jgi:hypothetical protein